MSVNQKWRFLTQNPTVLCNCATFFELNWRDELSTYQKMKEPETVNGSTHKFSVTETSNCINVKKLIKSNVTIMQVNATSVLRSSLKY